jgi:ssDNA-binding Zn-finger/Zn-ribbon topoisomerase 1
MKEAKCAQCGTIHIVLTESEALRYIEGENARAKREGRTPSASIESYRTCSVCGAAGDTFVSVEVGDDQVSRSVPIVICDTQGTEEGGAREEVTYPRSRTYLNVPSEMVSYAKRHGAIFDRSRQRFYVLGDAPSELVNLLPRPEVKRPHIVPPQCPKCGFHTVLIKNTKSGAWFFGCSRYRSHGCKGSVDYDKHLASLGIPNDTSALGSLRRISDPENESCDSAEQKRPGVSAEYREAFQEVVQLGIDTLGSQAQFMKWLIEPKVALKGRTPTEALKSLEGCADVKRLLLTLLD